MSGGFSIRDVSVAFGAVQALRGINLEIGSGERVAIVGPSGGGKSTLLRLLIGAVWPTDGCVSTLGQDLAHLSSKELRSLRSRVGFIHQNPGLVPSLRVVQNVACGRLGRTGFWSSVRQILFPSRRMVRDIHSLLERVGIAEKIHHRVDAISGGQQQRVGLARALWQQPEALLADEPVASLDPARARDILGLLARMSSEDGLTLCVSLHQFDLARDFFPRLVGLRSGRVVFDKASAEIGAEEFHALYDLTVDELLEDR
ncbi:MAG: phosphonate ABC transporter ATP-binding protein [Verrucomicrobiales bacterium]